MKRLFKHILSMILVLTLIIGAIPFSSLTAVKAEITEGTNYFNVSADLIDYYNDNRINGVDVTDNQGVQTGAYSPYGQLNQWISGLSDYAGTGSFVKGTNLIKNGDFEQGLDYWNIIHVSGSEAVRYDSGDPYVGNKCFFYSDSANANSIHQIVNVENGLYLATAYVKARGSSSSFYDCRMELEAAPDDAHKVFIDIDSIDDNIGNKGGYQYYKQISGTIRVEDGDIDIGFYCNSAGGTSLQIDSVELYKINENNLIANGDFETGNLEPWIYRNMISDKADDYSINGDDVYAGAKKFYFFSQDGNPYKQSIHQEVNVDKGLYLVTAFVKARGKDPESCQMEVNWDNKTKINIIDSNTGELFGPQNYQHISDFIEMPEGGSIDIGFYCNSTEGGTSLQIDNVGLYKIGETADEINSKPVPLYFGDLANRKQAGNGNLNWFWQAANVCILGGESMPNVSAKGIVADHLSDQGKLLSSYNSAPMPLFEENSYTGQDKYMKFYHGLQFPFTIKTDENGVTQYSFNSEYNTVYYDTDSNSLKRNDQLIITDWSDERGGTRGFFPFNKISLTSKEDANKLNFGFGTKFTIPFTVSSDGKDKSGNPITFNFSGDDDVWVFIDGALVLDMGGGHNKAQGSINFADQTATVTTGTIDARTGYQSVFSGGNYNANYNGSPNEITKPDIVYFSDITVNTAGGKLLSEYIQESGQIHTLTMYYMERGMYNSNMSVDFTFTPMPSGLSITKDVDVANVNTGLKTAVATKDTFDFTVSDDIKESEYSYKNINAASGEETAVKTSGKKITGLSDNIYAKDLTYADYKPLTLGTTISVVEDANPNYSTKWVATDVSNGSIIVHNDGNNAQFKLGEFDPQHPSKTASYNLNFVNTPKVGSVKATKAWDGAVPKALENTEFDFKAEVDLDGDGNGYQAYALAYTKGGVNGTTGQDGSFKIKVGETVTFDGIPVGAKVRVTETTTSGHAWESSTSTGEATVSEGTQIVAITNKTKTETVNKEIYVEAGRETLYKVADDGYEIEIPAGTVSTTDGSTKTDASLTANGTSTVKVTGSSPDEKYVFSYTGKDTGGRNVNGTITVYTYKATNKIYVFDYGLKSDLTATDSGDGLFQGGVFYNKNITGPTATLGSITAGTANGQTSITADPAVTINSDGSSTGHVYFEPEAFMDTVEEYTYKANITKNGATLDTENPDPETGTVVNGTIKVSPASTVYYEDNFNSDAQTDDSSVKIIYTGGTEPEVKPDLTITQSNDQSEEYGHDDAYETGETGDSAGSSTEMNANVGATARFTFKGTGFDIISRTNDKTATIFVTVKKKESKENESGTVVAQRIVDTYYNNGDLYQIPVISVMLDDYGIYEVTIKAKKAVAVRKDENGNAIVGEGEQRTVVYIDGIRIYNPLGVEEGSKFTDNDNDKRDDETGYTEGEYGAKIEEIRNMILGTDGKGTNGTVALVYPVSEGNDPGINVIYKNGNTRVEFLGTPDDGQKALKPESVDNLEDYLKKGPNNEVYLSYEDAIAFVVKPDKGKTPELQIEAKALKDTAGDKVSFAVLDLDGSKEEAGYYSVPVNSNTAMYYKIPLDKAKQLEDGSYLVVLMAVTKEEKYENIPMLSLTNIKYKNCSIGMPELTEKPDDEAETNLFSDSTYHINSMQQMVATAVRLAVAPETVPRYTEDIAVTGLSKNSLSAKKGAKANAVIKTTGETEGIVILDQNKEKIELTSCKKISSKDGINSFKVSFVASKTKGTYLYTVYAMNAAGFYSDKGTKIRVVIK